MVRWIARVLALVAVTGCGRVVGEGEACGGLTVTPVSCRAGLVCCDDSPDLADDPGVCVPEGATCVDDTGG